MNGFTLRSMEKFRCRCYGWFRDEIEAQITVFYRPLRWMWE